MEVSQYEIFFLSSATSALSVSDTYTWVLVLAGAEDPAMQWVSPARYCPLTSIWCRGEEQVQQTRALVQYGRTLRIYRNQQVTT